MTVKSKFSTTDLLHSIRHMPKSLISYVEKHVLTVLLSCMNADNETWHSMEYIADFACMSLSSINRYVKKLSQKKYISITAPTHYTHSQTNHYHLNLELILSFHPSRLTTDLSTSHVSVTPNMHENTQVACQPAMPSHVSVTPHRIADRHTKKERKKDTKKERALSPDFSNPKSQKPRATLLPEDWVHADIHEDRGMAMDMPSDDFFVCLDKFKAYVKANQIEKMDWDAEFDLWLIREGKYRAQQNVKNSLKAAANGSGGGSGRGQEEMRSTVPWLKPDPLRVIDIINKGNLNGLGSK